jgi:hypothetical protein
MYQTVVVKSKLYPKLHNLLNIVNSGFKKEFFELGAEAGLCVKQSKTTHKHLKKINSAYNENIKTPHKFTYRCNFNDCRM